MLDYRWSNKATALVDLFLGDGAFGGFGKYLTVIVITDKEKRGISADILADNAKKFFETFIQKNKDIISPVTYDMLTEVADEILWSEIGEAILENLQMILDEYDRWGEAYVSAIFAENKDAFMDNADIRAALAKHANIYDGELIVPSLDDQSE